MNEYYINCFACNNKLKKASKYICYCDNCQKQTREEEEILKNNSYKSNFKKFNILTGEILKEFDKDKVIEINALSIVLDIQDNESVIDITYSDLADKYVSIAYAKKLQNERNDFNNLYHAEYKTDDGHYVRSRGEQLIDNWLFYHNIPHAYEKQLTLNGIDYMPDFYIPHKNLYIEFWGLDDDNYNKRRFEKENAYKQNNIKYLNIEDSNLKNLDAYLQKHLTNGGH